MKKLFSDPHFNVMDGLDTYIDDYGKPDPIPLSMLRRMNQSAGARSLRRRSRGGREAPQLATTAQASPMVRARAAWHSPRPTGTFPPRSGR